MLKATALYTSMSLISLGFACADWQSDVGYTRLKSLTTLPGFPTKGVSQIEALDSGNYAPDQTSALFTGKTFTLKSGTSGTSNHANLVATQYYGSASILPGAGAVDCYNANTWLSGGFLQPALGGFPL